MHYKRHSPTHWTDEETGQNLDAATCATLEANWQRRDEKAREILFRNDGTLSASERAQRALGTQTLTDSQRAAIKTQILAVHPDAELDDKDDAYLVARMEATNALVAKRGAQQAERDVKTADRPERDKMLAEDADRSKTDAASDSALDDIKNMSRTSHSALKSTDRPSPTVGAHAHVMTTEPTISAADARADALAHILNMHRN